ncbi:MAG TPA: ScyD/ScyE family protein [Nocardioides sp.]|nr:ScyD/ScyE family protein [Nocardioides sp.]
MRRTPLIPVAVAAFALLGTALAPAAQAATPEVVVDGLVTPLSVAVADDGTVYASQNFASLITKAAPGAEPEVIFADEGQREIGALSITGDVLTFAATSQGGPAEAKVYTLSAEGQTEIADLWAYESSRNPDGSRTYGVGGLSKSCKADVPKKQRAWVLPYKGIKESHPYATAVAGDTTYVADAAANAIFAITDAGVSTAAVLPAAQIKITKKIRTAFKLPRCVQGKIVRTEAVPTDVEVGPDGNLYVTSLPGGPEDPAMGANGAVYQVNPTTHAVVKQGSGLVSPTGLAIGADGTAYISMLFASTVLAIPLGGTPAPLAEVALPGAVEYAGGYVYVTETDLMNDGSTPPAGKVVRIPVAVSD